MLFYYLPLTKESIFVPSGWRVVCAFRKETRHALFPSHALVLPVRVHHVHGSVPSVALLWVAFAGMRCFLWTAVSLCLCCHTHLLGMKCCVLWLSIIPPSHRAWIAELAQTSQLLLFASVCKLCSRERMCLCTCAETLILNVWVWGKEVMWLVWCYPLLSPIPGKKNGPGHFD